MLLDDEAIGTEGVGSRLPDDVPRGVVASGDNCVLHRGRAVRFIHDPRYDRATSRREG